MEFFIATCVEIARKKFQIPTQLHTTHKHLSVSLLLYFLASLPLLFSQQHKKITMATDEPPPPFEDADMDLDVEAAEEQQLEESTDDNDDVFDNAITKEAVLQVS